MTCKSSGFARIFSILVVFTMTLSWAYGQTTYHVGSTQPEDRITYFDTLENLRLTLETEELLLVDEDKIILYANDDSLTHNFNIGMSATVAVESGGANLQRTIKLQDGVSSQFFFTSQVTTGKRTKLTLDNIILEGGTSDATRRWGGGAVSVVYDANVIFRNAGFEGNSTSHSGGAFFSGVYINQDLHIIDSNFENNTAEQSGGAIRLEVLEADPTISKGTTNLTLEVTANRKSVFSGNRHGVGEDGSGGTANSISFQGYSEHVLQFDVVTERNALLDMADPFQTVAASEGTYTIDITKSGAGTWRLGGESVVAGSNAPTFTIEAGTLEFQKDAALKAVGQNDKFLVRRSAELSINGGNTIQWSEIVFEGRDANNQASSRLTFDFDFYNGGEAKSTPMLSLSGDTLEVAGTTINIKNLSDDPDERYGNYLLIEGESALKSGDFILYIDGEEINVSGNVSERFGYSLGNNITQETELYLRVAPQTNTVIEWTNGDEDESLKNQWSIYGANWKVMDQTPEQADMFVPGDTVVFNMNGSHIIELSEIENNEKTYPILIAPNAKTDGDDKNYYVNRGVGMHVDGNGSWTFLGASITDAVAQGDPDGVAAALLFSGNGVLTLANEEANTYTGGTILTGHGTLMVDRPELLGSGDIRFEETVRSNYVSKLHLTDGMTLNKRIMVSAGANGRITVDDGKELILSRTGDPVEAAGGLSHLSGGRLTVEGTDTAPIRIRGNQAVAGGAFYVENGGTLVASGRDERIETGDRSEKESEYDSGVTFEENRAGERGGAVYASQSDVHLKNVLFKNNAAGIEGGAVYYVGGSNRQLVIEASDGQQTTFEGNKANGSANSIHFAVSDVMGSVTQAEIRTEGNGTVRMIDPMSGTTENNRSIRIDKTGTGTWALAGTSRFAANGTGRTEINIVEGTLLLAREGALTDESEAGTLELANGTFRVGEQGTLLSGGGNRIAARTVELAENATLAFDMDSIEPENEKALLEIQANWNGTDWSTSKVIDLVNLDTTTIEDPDQTNRYFLIAANNAIAPNAALTLRYEGTDVSKLRVNFGELAIEGNNLYIDITKPLNGTSEWTGGDDSGNRIWDMTSHNWKGTDLGSDDLSGGEAGEETTQFLNGDGVLFGDFGSGVVTVHQNGVRIADQNSLKQPGQILPGMTVANSEGNDYTFQGGSIGGTGALLKQGEGTLTFKDSNTFSGGTVIENGTVVALKGSSLGIGDIEIRNPALLQFDIGSIEEDKLVQRLTGDGTLLKTGYGSLALTQSSPDFDGHVEIRGGTLILEAVDALGRSDVDTGDVTGRGTLVFRKAEGEYTGLITGLGKLAVSGESDLVLSGTNTYSGGTTVDSGSTLTIAGLAAVGSGNIAINGTFVLDFDDTVVLLDDRTLEGSGLFRKTGSGALELRVPNDFSGTTELLDGTIRLVDHLALQNSTLNYLGGEFSFDMNNEATLGGLAGDRDLDLSNGNDRAVNLTIGTNHSDAVYSGVLSGGGSVTKVGRGTQVLEGKNTYTGGTTLDGGRLVAVGTAAIGTGDILNNAELEFRIDGAASDVETYAKSIAGTGSLEKSGAGVLELTAVNTYEGGTVVREGTLRVATLQSLGMQLGLEAGEKAGTVRLEDGTVLQVDLDAAATAEDGMLRKNISGSGILRKTGSGTMTIDTDIDLKGRIEVRAGTLFLNGKTDAFVVARNGGTLQGTGYVDNSVLIRQGASQRVGYKEDAPLGTFTAKNLDYEGGSTVYLKIGQHGSDRIVAKEGLNFAKNGGVVNVVLLNFGSETLEEVESNLNYELFRSDEGDIRVKGKNVATGTTGGDFLTLNGTDGIRFSAGPDEDLSVIGLEVKSTGNLSKGIFVDVLMTGSGTNSYLNPNQWATLGAVGDPRIYDTVFAYSKGARGAIVNQMMPMVQSAMPFLTNRSVTQFNAGTFERLRFLREPLRQPEHSDGSATVRGNAPTAGLPKELPHYAWFQQYGDFILMQGKGDRPEFRADSYGFNVGFDRSVTRQSAVGIGMGGYFSDVKVNDFFQKGTVDSFLVAAYGDWSCDAGWLVTASSGFVFSRYDLQRNAVAFDTQLNSKHDGTTYFISIEGMKKLYFGRGYEISPFIGLDAIWLREKGYEESANALGLDSLALKFDKQRNHSVLMSMGLRLGRSFRSLGGNIVNPSVYAAWVHDLNTGGIVTTSAFPGEKPFSIQGASMYRDRAQVGANLNMTIGQRFDMFTRFNAELGDHMNDLTVHWGIRMGF